MILLIDNYDSFSYNLFQLIGEIEQDIKVIRNDEMTVSWTSGNVCCFRCDRYLRQGTNAW